MKKRGSPGDVEPRRHELGADIGKTRRNIIAQRLRPRHDDRGVPYERVQRIDRRRMSEESRKSHIDVGSD
ncbi:MAG TPA: hypothetical protein VN744_16160, partial [Casimicrobiaceae bacterium]|nr:hypothetical protein [Casimicrobiaceae bacterium]